MLSARSRKDPGRVDALPSDCRPSSHSRVLSQPCLMPQTPTVLGGARSGCGPANAANGPYAGVSGRLLKSRPSPRSPDCCLCRLTKAFLHLQPSQDGYQNLHPGVSQGVPAALTPAAPRMHRTPFQLHQPQRTNLLRSRHIHQFLSIILTPLLRFLAHGFPQWGLQMRYRSLHTTSG